MRLVRPSHSRLPSFAAGSTTWAAQHDQHKGHHPAGSASAAAAKATPGKTTPEMARMDNQMKAGASAPSAGQSAALSRPEGASHVL